MDESAGGSMNGQIVTTSLTMTSREIADLTGKHHFHVTTDIEKMLAELDEDATGFRGIYFDSMNRQQTEYHLDRELTETLLTGYSAILRRKVIARWHELEAQAAAPVMALPQDYIQALESLLVSKKSEQLAIAGRDHAIATKAQIGNRREATAMATASAARKESAKLKDQLGFSARHATILQVEDKLGGDFHFLPLRNWCKANEVTPETVPDKRYPNGVKAWPAGAWAAAYGVVLGELFGEEV
jgi:phage regulator Rha-like protein